MIIWLMGWPAGLKLNGELAEFLGALSLWVIECWNQTVTPLITSHLPTIVYFIGFSSFAGASMPIAIFSDLLSLLTLHIYSIYIASARIFNLQLTIIYSLFQLFRGKKRNVLRHRIDSCDYDLDQLLLGTILFTLLFFLLPTVLLPDLCVCKNEHYRAQSAFRHLFGMLESLPPVCLDAARQRLEEITRRCPFHPSAISSTRQ